MARVLIVEDEPIAALELKESVEALGHQVTGVVESADEVLVQAFRAKPELVLMDINLRSYSDGIDAASRLRVFSPAPLIFVTAYGDHALRERAKSAGAAAYLVKPVDQARLEEAIALALAAKG